MGYKSKYTGPEVEERLRKVDDIPKKLSQLDNDLGYIDKEDVEHIEREIENLSEQVGGFKWIEVN